MNRDDELPKGKRLGKYEIIGLLGAGGMGAVYEAVHTDLKKRVAVKILHPDYARKPNAAQRFMREGEAASRIRHPHVVDITDVGIEGEMAFLVMEYLDGVDLKAHLVRYAPLPVEEAVDMMLPVVAAVAAGHDVGVVHRDLKPHNIFMARHSGTDVHMKVLDFGLSKLLDEGGDAASLTGTTAVMGTVAYMSPEQAKGAKFVDSRTDQYSLGLIVYECVTGLRAHKGENTLAMLRQIGDGTIEPPRSHKGDLPADLERVIMKTLATKQGDRFPHLYALGRSLLPFASERGKSIWLRAFDREPSVASQSIVVEIAEDGAAMPVGMTNSPSTQLIRPTPVVRAAAGESTMGRQTGELAPPASQTALVSRSKTATIAAVALVAVAVVAVAMLKSTSKPEPSTPASAASAVAPKPKTMTIAVVVDPAEAEILLDDKPVGRGSFTQEVVPDGREHTLRVTAAGFEPKVVVFTDIPPPSRMVLEHHAKKPAARGPKPEAPKPAATPAPIPAAKVGANQSPIIKE